MNDIKKMLEGVRDGTVSVEEAVLELKKSPFEDIGCAKVDSDIFDHSSALLFYRATGSFLSYFRIFVFSFSASASARKR